MHLHAATLVGKWRTQMASTASVSLTTFLSEVAPSRAQTADRGMKGAVQRAATGDVPFRNTLFERVKASGAGFCSADLGFGHEAKNSTHALRLLERATRWADGA